MSYNCDGVIETYTWWCEDMDIAPWDVSIETSTSLIYKFVMDECIHQVKHRVQMKPILKNMHKTAFNFFKKATRKCENKVKAIERKMDKLNDNKGTHKNENKWYEKYTTCEQQRYEMTMKKKRNHINQLICDIKQPTDKGFQATHEGVIEHQINNAMHALHTYLTYYEQCEEDRITCKYTYN